MSKKKGKKKGLKGLKDTLKDAFQNAKDKIKSFIDHPQNLVASAGLTPLLPYQHIMKKKLKKIGKPQGNNLEETTHNFVKYVMGINTFEEWQFENFQNASFTTTIEDLDFADEEYMDPTIILALVQLIPVILQFIMTLKKKEPDLDDPQNPSPDIDSDMLSDPAAMAILLPLAENMIQYLAKAGQTYSNDPIENAIKIYQLTYPTFEFENLSDDLKEFWQNNRDKILSTIGALFVAIGTDPAPDPISQRIGKAVSSTQTAIKKETKKQTMLKTYTPLLILAAILLIIVLTKKK